MAAFVHILYNNVYAIFLKRATEQKIKFSTKDFFSIVTKLRIWSRLLKKSFAKNFIFCAVNDLLLFISCFMFFLKSNEF